MKRKSEIKLNVNENENEKLNEMKQNLIFYHTFGLSFKGIFKKNSQLSANMKMKINKNLIEKTNDWLNFHLIL